MPLVQKVLKSKNKGIWPQNGHFSGVLKSLNFLTSPRDEAIGDNDVSETIKA